MKRRIILKVLDGPHERYPWGMRLRAYRGQTKNQKAWLSKRLLEKARVRMITHLGVKPLEVKFAWCGLCQYVAILCPECGNNTCNGGSPCGRCYEYEEIALLARNNVRPKREELPNPENTTPDFVFEDWGEEFSDEDDSQSSSPTCT